MHLYLNYYLKKIVLNTKLFYANNMYSITILFNNVTIEVNISETFISAHK